MSTLAGSMDLTSTEVRCDGDDHRKIVANIMANWDYVVRSTVMKISLDNMSSNVNREPASWHTGSEKNPRISPCASKPWPRNRSTRNNVFCQLYDHGLDSDILDFINNMNDNTTDIDFEDMLKGIFESDAFRLLTPNIHTSKRLQPTCYVCGQ